MSSVSITRDVTLVTVPELLRRRSIVTSHSSQRPGQWPGVQTVTDRSNEARPDWLAVEHGADNRNYDDGTILPLLSVGTTSISLPLLPAAHKTTVYTKQILS